METKKSGIQKSQRVFHVFHLMVKDDDDADDDNADDDDSVDKDGIDFKVDAAYVVVARPDMGLHFSDFDI